MSSNLERISDELMDLTAEDATLLIERLVKIHGGEILDDALDRMIDNDEHGEWPDAID